MQAAVDEVAEGVNFVLKVRVGRSVHLLEFLLGQARSAHFCRIEVADFCLELRHDLSS